MKLIWENFLELYSLSSSARVKYGERNPASTAIGYGCRFVRAQVRSETNTKPKSSSKFKSSSLYLSPPPHMKNFTFGCFGCANALELKTFHLQSKAQKVLEKLMSTPKFLYNKKLSHKLNLKKNIIWSRESDCEFGIFRICRKRNRASTITPQIYHIASWFISHLTSIYVVYGGENRSSLD
jgi:hypothetical protein